MALNPKDFANIHDVHIEKGIVPFPRGVYEQYEKDNKRFKLFQSRWYEIEEKRTGSSSYKRPKLLELPIHIKELPTHFMKREGRRVGPPMEWPRTGQDLSVECLGEKECLIFLNRGYLCKLHNPSTSTLQLVSHEKATKFDFTKATKYIRN